MYTKTSAKAAKREWNARVTNVGTASNIAIQVYQSFFANTFTTATRPALSSSTFLLVPDSQILFSLQSFVIGKGQMTTPSQGSVSVAMLDNAAFLLWKKWVGVEKAAREAVKELTKRAKK
jgi:hypothetical protein